MAEQTITIQVTKFMAEILQRLLTYEQMDQDYWDMQDKGRHQDIREHVKIECQKLQSQLKEKGVKIFYICDYNMAEGTRW